MFQELLARSSGDGAHHRSPNTPFHKQLRWLINNPPEHSIVMEIGPKEAAEMLRYNVDEEGNSLNRPRSVSATSGYARQMKGGRWVHTGQPIIFSRRRLLDGQHRLEGIVESGVTIKCDVRFGIDDKAFSVIDIGRKRTASDIFAINGVPNHALVSAAVRWVIAYHLDAIGGARGTHGSVRTSQLTPEELYEHYLQHTTLQESGHYGRLFAQSKLAPPALMTAFHYLCAKKAQQQANAFFEMIGTGFGFPTKSCPAFRLHRRLIDNATGSEKIDGPTMAAFTVKAWNATRRSQPVGAFNWTSSSEKFPRIV